MQVDRLKRYKDKLDLIAKRIDELIEWKEDFLLNEKSKLASYKAFQEIVEASMDIIAMLIKDENLVPKDDYSNIDIIEKNGMLNNDLCPALRDMNGLRNRIIHEYNGLSDNLALDTIEELIPKVRKLVENIETWLKEANLKG